MQQQRAWRVVLVSMVMAVCGVGPSVPGAAEAAILELQSGDIELNVALPNGIFVSAPAMNPSGTIAVMVSSGAGNFSLPAGFFEGAETLPIDLFTGVPLISSLGISGSNLAGSFSAGGGPGRRESCWAMARIVCGFQPLPRFASSSSPSRPP